ncbi:hypothetical protein POM88_034274 [Heracleum sosnowskyi]|uniref:Transposase-associated domain-containing protein n=1 Tax=Heracleum sosnowskyi TaxID=360622 RepID=A0AAD8HIY7_9APIA|nr:hypothetical protein POM88_034274 [Heracleum sosnowskyi]
MDRNWVKADRMSEEYKKGVTEFCKYAAKHVKDTRFILCPCEKCLNVVQVDGLTKLEEHLRIHGIDKTYTCWTYHGEKKGERSSSNLNSNYPFIDGGDNNITVDNDCSNSSGRNDIPNVTNEELHDHPDMSERLKDDCALPLWHGCTKFSKLSAVLTLYNLKVGHQVSDVFFTELLTTVSELLPEGNVLPRRTYLYEVYLSKNLDLAAKFSFVSPHLVSPLVDNSDTSLAKCLLGHVDKDHLLLQPYNISGSFLYFHTLPPFSSFIFFSRVTGTLVEIMAISHKKILETPMFPNPHPQAKDSEQRSIESSGSSLIRVTKSPVHLKASQ